MSREKRDVREKAKLDGVTKRQEEAALRTPEEQLARLDARGASAVKERAKLQARIAARNGDNNASNA